MEEKVDILIIHLNGEKIIDNCLKSIYKNTKNFDIYLLLNGTCDNSRRLVKEKYKKVKLFDSKKTIGFAQASNLLANKAKSNYILFLNNDTIVEKNWLDELKKTIKKRENCVAVQGKIMSYYEKEKFEYAGAAGGYIDKYGYPFCRGRIFGEIEQDKGQFDDEKRIFWACGVCMLVKKMEFINFGGFDEGFFMYGEETDFCWRANIYGKEIWYCPKSKIYHIGSWSVNNEKINLRKEYLLSRNHILILLKNYSLISLIKILPFRIILELISAIRFFPKKTYGTFMTLITLPFQYFIIFHNKRKLIQKQRKIEDKNLRKINIIYNGSIAIDYFIRGKNKFEKLKF